MAKAARMFGEMVEANLAAQETEVQTSEPQCPEEQLRIAAYLNWERQTNGTPVDDEATKNFWLEAEKQLTEE